MYAREVGQREARGGYRFAILGDREADTQDLFTVLRERIRHGLSVRHVQETEQGWQLTQAHRLSGVIEWNPETEGGLPSAALRVRFQECGFALRFSPTKKVTLLRNARSIP